jgi:hypothetical protein
MRLPGWLQAGGVEENDIAFPSFTPSDVAKVLSIGFLSASLAFGSPAFAENELSDRYGGGLDASLVDQTCLVDQCGGAARACLADDPSCRKGLTCTAKCLGDNACITGCMARYGNKNLDNLLKCTIEDHECIKVAILPGGADKFGEEPQAPAPVVPNFDVKTLEGSWYKVVGYNPNYDCYACQRNRFHQEAPNEMAMDVEFSMPHLLPDGSPAPPSGVRENIWMEKYGSSKPVKGGQSMALNDYSTHETMIFDKVQNPLQQLVLHEGTTDEVSYHRTAHSEGEMFGLSKFDVCRHAWKMTELKPRIQCSDSYISLLSLCSQNSGRTGTLSVKMIPDHRNSSLCTTMARRGKTPTKALSFTVAPRISRQNP